MTDLTVLISPTPLHIPVAKKNPFSFTRSTSCLIRPVMVTLETERQGVQAQFESRKEENDDRLESKIENKSQNSGEEEEEEEADILRTDSETSQPPTTRRRGRTPSRVLDPNFLSPPINTFKSSPSSGRRSRHRHTRSQSAPPAPVPATCSNEEEVEAETTEKFITIAPSATINTFNRSLPRRSFTSFGEKSGKRNGDLLPPPPPLLRPTTFWRKTRRSGVTAASYSPSYHLIRRSTFVAAGLDLDTPSHDLRAYCVENRIGFIVVPPDSFH